MFIDLYSIVMAMKSLIVLLSYHHKNTEKIAEAMASILDAEIKTPQQIDPGRLSEYDRVGFGSGIYLGQHHKVLLDFADKLPQVTNKKAFIFSTSGQTGKTSKFHQRLKEKLQSKGYNVVAEFNCAGFGTFGALKIVGGIKKGRPNAEDVKQAEIFAQNLMQKT
jgi:flavodoxin